MARVLVVEDEPSLGRLFKLALEEAGHQVAVRPDGPQGLEAYQEINPEVILLDWMMPGMSGLELLEKIKASGGRTKTRIVLVTGKVQESDMLRAWQSGIDDYLTKPVDLDELVGHVEQVLAMSDDDLAKRRGHEIDRARLLRTLDDLMDE